MVFGRVVCSTSNSAVSTIERYEFRTAGTYTQSTPGLPLNDRPLPQM
jgi:hypothetical protein